MKATDTVANEEITGPLLESDSPCPPRDLIIRHLDRWRQLTRQESQAVQQADWDEVKKLQTAKASLRRPLQTLLDQWKNSEAARMENIEPFYLKPIEELIALESQNIDLLSAQKQAALERKRLFDQSARNLRMIRDSYAGALANGWQAYS